MAKRKQTTTTNSIRVEVDTSRLNRILRNLNDNTGKATRATAFVIEAKAKQNIQTMQAIDTGSLLNSIYTRTSSGAYESGQRVASVPPIPNNEAERQELPRPKSNEATVGPSVNYGIYVELGANGVSPRPYLAQAVRDTTNELASHFEDVVTDG